MFVVFVNYTVMLVKHLEICPEASYLLAQMTCRLDVESEAVC